MAGSGSGYKSGRCLICKPNPNGAEGEPGKMIKDRENIEKVTW